MNKIIPIYLANDTILLQLTSGPKFITKDNLAYHRLKQQLPLYEDAVLELLKTPPLPDGLFKVFLFKDIVFILNITDNGTKSYTLIDAKFRTTNTYPKELSNLLGVFTSFDEVRDYLPEYFI